MKPRLLFGVTALALALAMPSTGHAQSPAEKETARHLMDEGDKHFEEKRYEQALRAYESAHAIMHVPSTGVEVARAHAAMGRLIEAREAALAVTRMPGAESEPKPFAEARRHASRLADGLAARIPTLRVELPSDVDLESLRASIDYEEIATTVAPEPKQLNPGKHVVRARADGYATFVREVDVKEGGETVVKIELSGHYPKLPLLGPTPPVAIAALSVAATGLVVGTITGIASLSRTGSARDLCGSDTRSCPPEAASDIDAAKTLGWVSTVSFALALVGGGIATYSILSTREGSSKGKPRVDVVMLPTGAGLTGAF